jgi:hypothetical protein
VVELQQIPSLRQHFNAKGVTRHYGWPGALAFQMRSDNMECGNGPQSQQQGASRMIIASSHVSMLAMCCMLSVSVAATPPSANESLDKPEAKADKATSSAKPEVDPRKLEIFAKLYVLREYRLKKLQYEIVRLKRRRQGQQVKRLQEEIDQIKQGKLVLWPTLPLPVPSTPGEFGKLSRSVKVMNVIDSNEAIVRILTVNHKLQVLWMKGWNTATWVSDEGISIPQVVEVTGVRDYKTVVGGSNRVVVLEPLDESEFRFKPMEDGKPSPTKKTTSSSSSIDPEKAAAKKLELAKKLAKQGKNSTAQRWFKEIVEKYPKTSAATEAKKLIE